MRRESRETLEELNRRAKKLAREARPAYRIRRDRFIVAWRITALCLFMIAVCVGVVWVVTR